MRFDDPLRDREPESGARGPGRACQKGSKRWVFGSSGIPGPVSATKNRMAPSARPAFTATRPPRGVNLIALPIRFAKTWKDASAVCRVGRQAGGDVGVEANRFLAGQ